MSKANVQSFVILALANGTMILMEEDDKLVPDYLPTVLYISMVAKEAIDSWPENGDPHKTTDKCIKHCKRLQSHFDNASDLYTPLCLIYLANHLLNDLDEKIIDPKKKELLAPVMEGLLGLAEKLDPFGDKFEMYEYTEKLADIVREEIGFEVTDGIVMRV